MSLTASKKRGPNKSTVKQHNGELGRKAKTEIRENVLAELGPEGARVFDGFCGPVGEMYHAVWRRAADYVGVDTEWESTDDRRRYVAECALVLRSIDLQPYNVFDLDTFGCPWAEGIVLAARRRWAPGERGAIVITDGGQGKLKFGKINSLSTLVGGAYHKSLCEPMQRAALVAWCKRARVTPERIWISRGYSNTKGSQEIFYAAVVFHGVTARAAGAS